MTTPNLARWSAFHSLIQPRHWGIECGDDGDEIVVAPALSEETAKFVAEAYNKLLERLSRERDTGFWLAPNEITLWMIAAAHRAGYVFVGATADEVVELTERKMSEPDTVPLGLAQWEAIRAAAPQPPSVSGETAFGAKDVLGRPTAPEAWFQAAQKETRNWTLPGLGEDDDPHCGYPLIDALSNPGKNATVKEGIERAAELADDVVLAVWKVAEPEITRLSAELVEARKALEKIIDRSENGELGTSKVRDMAHIARAALSPKKDTDTPETGVVE